jgi:uncharacterized protein (DUF1015 family)
MTRIQPFKAIIYNQGKIKDLSRVVCPPYDIISPERQEYYHALDPHNLIHILLAKDIPGEDKYRRAAAYFESWIADKTLVQDTRPAIYFYSHQYKIRGESKVRLGFIARLRLSDQESSVFGHEHTRLEPKEDRLKLLRSVKANLSPIFIVFPDAKRMIQRVNEKYVRESKPFLTVVDDDKNCHMLWRLDQEDVVREMSLAMRDENVFIADGHHRYEVACMYRDEMRRLGVYTEDDSSNYIMAYFTSAQSRGLTIFATHRLVQLPASFDWGEFRSGLVEYFDIEEVRDKTQFLFLLEKAGATEHCLGMYRGKKHYLLRLKNVKMLDKVIADKPAEYRQLDVSVLNHIVLHKLLGMSAEGKTDLEFLQDPNEMMRRVDEEKDKIAFFLNPVKMSQVMSVALKGEKMPPKSTYFYPKVLSGLVINKL